MQPFDIAFGQTFYSAAARYALHLYDTMESGFGPDLFGDPAMRALLNVLIAEEEGFRLGFSDLAVMCSGSLTTGGRWIARLEGDGYMERQPDLHDRRRTFVKLTEDGRRRLYRWAERSFSAQPVLRSVDGRGGR